MLGEADSDGARQMFGGVRSLRTQVHHPLTGADPSCELLWICGAGQGQINPSRASPVQRSHVGVVARISRQASDKSADEVVLVVGDERVVALAFQADRARRAADGRSGGAKAAEPVGGVQRRVIGNEVDQASGRAVLGPGELVDPVRIDKIGTPHAPKEQRSATEDDRRALLVAHDVGEMAVGVARGRDNFHGHAAHSELVPIRDRPAVKCHFLCCGHYVGGPGPGGQLEPTADVVIMDMGLEDEIAVESQLDQDRLDPVDVTLGVDDHCGLPVVGDIAPVAELVGREDLYVDHRHLQVNVGMLVHYPRML